MSLVFLVSVVSMVSDTRDTSDTVDTRDTSDTVDTRDTSDSVDTRDTSHPKYSQPQLAVTCTCTVLIAVSVITCSGLHTYLVYRYLKTITWLTQQLKTLPVFHIHHVQYVGWMVDMKSWIGYTQPLSLW